MQQNNILLRLRNRENIKVWDRSNKMFIHFQLNKKDGHICWERWYSKDRSNWVKQNSYLTLKETIREISKLYTINKELINQPILIIK